MRISDWSSDVCSSDLLETQGLIRGYAVFLRRQEPSSDEGMDFTPADARSGKHQADAPHPPAYRFAWRTGWHGPATPAPTANPPRAPAGPSRSCAARHGASSGRTAPATNGRAAARERGVQ